MVHGGGLPIGALAPVVPHQNGVLDNAFSACRWRGAIDAGITIIATETEMIFIIAVILLLIGIVAFALYRIILRRKPLIEQAFLIYKDGALLAHATGRVVKDMDTVLFTSMLTVIQDFVKDSFKDEKKWDLRKLEFEGHKIMIEYSTTGNLRIALVYRGKGDEERLLSTARVTLARVEHAFGDILRDWDGNLDDLHGTRDIMMEELGKD